MHNYQNLILKYTHIPKFVIFTLQWDTLPLKFDYTASYCFISSLLQLAHTKRMSDKIQVSWMESTSKTMMPGFVLRFSPI